MAYPHSEVVRFPAITYALSHVLSAPHAKGQEVLSRLVEKKNWVFTDTLLLTYLNTLLVATMTTFINFMVSSIDIQELTLI